MEINFTIKKPLVFFDLETTGISVFTDRIVEISVAKLMPDGEFDLKTRRLNPEKPIPAEATAIHGITDADVADKPTFKSISSSLLRYFDNCDLGGFNLQRFDIPLLTEEFKRSGLLFSIEGRKIVDVQTIFHKCEPRTLSAAYKFYCGKDIEKAHSAEGDVLATVEILNSQLKKYENLPKSMEELHAYCNLKEPNWIDGSGRFKWQNNVATVGFGKNEGTPLKDIAVNNPDFLNWMINASFPMDAVAIAKNALKGIFPEKK